MSRPLLALAVIAASSVGGVWIHAATRSAPRPAATESATAVSRPAETSTTATSTAKTTELATSRVASAPTKPAPAASTTKSGFHSAMRIAADPVTGQIVTPEYTDSPISVEAMQELARLEGAGLVTIQNLDGSETLNHDGRFTDHTVVRIGADGKPVFRCVHGDHGVSRALRPTAPVTTKMEDR